MSDYITTTVDEHIRALEEKKRRLIETLTGMYESKEKVRYSRKTSDIRTYSYELSPIRFLLAIHNLAK